MIRSHTMHSREAPEQKEVKLALDRLDLYPAYDVARKGIGEQISRSLAAYSTSPQVEQSLLIELAYRCAMRAPHIIREYLQLRLCIDQRMRRKQEVLVGLVGIGL